MDVKTVVVLDHAHCGTTMLAGMLEIAGVPMVGSNYKEEKWEDLDIVESLSSGNEKRFARIVKQRNDKYDIWGFKYAGAWRFMDLMVKHLRNPIFLAIYKDPVTVTMRRFGNRHAFMGKVKNTLKQFIEGMNGMLATRQPVYALSYHKAVVAPEQFAQEVMDIVGIEADVDKLARFIQPNRESPRARYPSVKRWVMVRYEES